VGCIVIVTGQRLPIVIATKPVDFRSGHNALALNVQTELKLDPHSGVTVVFCSKRGDRLKSLVWDGSGMVLIYKVMEQGIYAWPRVQDGVMRLSRAQFEARFEGLDWRQVVSQRLLAPTAEG
jgi:transposase